jgi:ParB family chromosome partitioning protein
MKKVLGKGLGSLIPEKAGNEVSEVNIDNIVPNQFQMRTDFNEEKIEEMAESIKKEGLIQPVIVTRKGNKYMLIAGERRLRAAKKAGFSSIPCIEKEMDGENLLVISLIENIQRENLSPVEEASAYDMMAKEFSMTQQEISKKVGKSRSAVANILRILSLPEDLRILVNQEKLSAGHARALLSVKDTKKRLKLAEKILKEKLTVRETEKFAAIASGLIKKKSTGNSLKKADPEIRDMEEKFEKALGTRVSIKQKGKNKGIIKIEFYSSEDFERISDVITCGK